MDSELKQALDIINKICPDYAVAIKHGDIQRANDVLHSKRNEIERKIHDATFKLNEQLEAINSIVLGNWDGLMWELRMRIWCGWQPNEEQWQAMKVLGIELESEAGNGE